MHNLEVAGAIPASATIFHMRSGKRRFRFKFLAAIEEVDVVSKPVRKWSDGTCSWYDTVDYEEVPVDGSEIPPAVVSFTVDAYTPEEAQKKIQRYIAWNLKISQD